MGTSNDGTSNDSLTQVCLLETSNEGFCDSKINVCYLQNYIFLGRSGKKKAQPGNQIGRMRLIAGMDIFIVEPLR